MNFRATVDKPNERTNDGRTERGRGRRANKPVDGHVSRRISCLEVGHTDDLHDLKRAGEGEGKRHAIVGGVRLGLLLFWDSVLAAIK